MNPRHAPSRPPSLETGATLRVPLFLELGELIEVDTRSGETPEQILRATRKDLCFIRSLEVRKHESKGMKAILAWIRTNLPGTRVEPIGPSLTSGSISRYGAQYT